MIRAIKFTFLVGFFFQIKFICYAQSIDQIDGLRNEISNSKKELECLLYTKFIYEGTSDSIWFYFDEANLKYIKSKRSTVGAASSDYFAFNEYLIDSGKVLYYKSYGYNYFLDGSIMGKDSTQVTYIENPGSYFKYDGSPIICFEEREITGPYYLIDSLISANPPKAKRGILRCSFSPQKYFEENFLNIFLEQRK